MKKEMFELIALDAIVLIICAVQLDDWLKIFQICAALSATAYSVLKIYDWMKEFNE